MGTSFRDIVNRGAAPPAQSQGLVSFSDIAGQEEQQGSTIGNRFSNLWKLYKVSMGQASGEEYAEVARIAQAAEGTMPGAMQKIGKDIVSMLSYYGKKPPVPGSTPGPSLTEQLKGITLESALAGIPDAFTSIVTAPVESVLGVGLDRDTLFALTPEERATAIKTSAANVAMFMATAGAGSAVKGAYAASTAAKLGKAASVAELRTVAEKTAGGALKRALTTGTTEAAAGGLAQAGVANFGEDDMATQMLINGILFAPLGAAFERVKYLGKSTDKLGRHVANEADRLQQLRQLQVTTKDSFSGVLYKLDGLENADNLAEAVLSSKLRATPDRPVVVPGVTGDQLPKLIGSIARGETKVTPSFYRRPDGKFDMLVGDDNKLTNTARRSFSETGLVPNQLVDVNGKTYYFKSLSKDGQRVNLRTMTGGESNKARSAVRIRSEFETHDVTPANAGDQIYNDFKRHVMGDVPAADPSADFWDGTPTKSFDELLQDFAKSRGFNDAETAVLERDLTDKLFNDTLRRLPDEERVVIEALSKEIEETVSQPGGSKLEQAQIAAKEASTDVIRAARSNGMYVDEEAAGNLTLRDMLTDKVMFRGKTTREALDFIDKSGQADGVDLDGGGPLPPRLGSGLMPADGEPWHGNDAPFAMQPNDKFGDIVAASNTIFDWATPNRNIVQSLDTKFNTQLFSKVFDTTQRARLKANAFIRPWYEKLEKVDAIAVKLNAAQRRTVAGWLETMSQDEVKARGGQGGRALNDVEIQLAERFAAQDVDLSKTQQYIRAIDQIDKDVAAGKMDAQNAQAAKFQELQTRGLSDQDLQAVELIRQTKESKVAWFGSVARLTNAIRNKDVTRAEYAALHKMNPQQLRLAESIEGLYKELARTFNIPEQYRLENFMTHARLYSEGNISRTLRDFDVPPAVKDFYAALARTGEISAYEKDPVRSLQRYIKAGFDSRVMSPVIKNARQALDEELLKLPDDARGKTKLIVERYLNDVQGVPGKASKFTQSVVDDLLPKIGIKVPVDVRQNIVNTILATGEAAAQGFRVVAGIRDFYQGVAWYYSRFGVARTLKMLEYGTKGLDGITKRELGAGGLIPELNTLFFSSPTESAGATLGSASNAIGRGLRNVSQVGLKMSGQKDVYALLHAGSYLDTWKTAGDQLTKLSRGETSKVAAYKKLLIDTYDTPVIKEFDRLVNAEQYDAAAKFLARQTGAEQVGVFGSGNNPGGWNRNVGRIMGQFGSWPVWYRAQLTQMLSRGTYGQRAAALARFAATQGALVGASIAAGVNLRNWFAPTAFAYSGGPVLNLLQSVGESTLNLYDTLAGTGNGTREGFARLKQYLPYDPEADEFRLNQIYIPGSFFMNDLFEAYELQQQGDPMAPVRALGIRPMQ